MNPVIVQAKTIILGAGLAGISAGVNLLKNNYDDFMIFEALERIGGRVCTEINNNGYYELGCQWIHGQKNNPLFEIAKENGLIKEGYEEILIDSVKTEKKISLTNDQLLEDFNIATCDDKLLFMTQHGKRISSDFGKLIYDRITQLIASAKLTITKGSNFDIRYGDFLYDGLWNDGLEQELEELLRGLGPTDLTISDLKEVIDGVFMMRAKRENISAGSGNIFDVSLKHFSCWKEFEGHGYVELKKGYRPIIDTLIKPYEEEFYSRTNLNHYVKKIHLCQRLDAVNEEFYGNKPCTHCQFTSDPKKVVLRMCNNSDPNKPKDFFIICNNVICTMSLGYFKENLNKIFQPIGFITNERRMAVSRLGFGTINKVVLFYDKPFWNKNLQLMHMIWTPVDENFQLDRFIHRNSNKRIWTEDISKIEVVNSYPNALCAWITGSEFFEALDDKTIASDCTELLRRFMNDDQIPEPVSIKRSKWNTNRFSKGSYSHIPLGGDPDDYKRLAEPIPSKEDPMIMFAGEATHENYYQSTHGAYLTGIRESNRILGI